VEQYGADTVRLFTMFAAPPEQTLEWNDAGVEGASRFLRRLWKLVHDHLQAGTPGTLSAAVLDSPQKDLRRKTHETIVRVSKDYGERQTFNTAIAAVMELTNDIQKLADRHTPQGLAVEREAIETAVRLLNPIVPHIAHHLWQALGHTQDIFDGGWPVADESALSRSTATVVVQVNGKVRAQLEVAVDCPSEDVQAVALQNEHVVRFMEGKALRKVIHVPNKLLNLVVG